MPSLETLVNDVMRGFYAALHSPQFDGPLWERACKDTDTAIDLAGWLEARAVWLNERAGAIRAEVSRARGGTA